MRVFTCSIQGKFKHEIHAVDASAAAVEYATEMRRMTGYTPDVIRIQDQQTGYTMRAYLQSRTEITVDSLVKDV
jgi:hypothetical protein